MSHRQQSVELALKEFISNVVEGRGGTFLSSKQSQEILITTVEALDDDESASRYFGICTASKQTFTEMYHSQEGKTVSSFIRFLALFQKNIHWDWVVEARRLFFDAYYSDPAAGEFDEEIGNGIYAEVVCLVCLTSTVHIYLYCLYGKEAPWSVKQVLSSSSMGESAQACCTPSKLKVSEYAGKVNVGDGNWLPCVEGLVTSSPLPTWRSSDCIVEAFLAQNGVAGLNSMLNARLPWALFTLNLGALLRFNAVQDVLYLCSPRVMDHATNILPDRLIRRDQIEVVAFATTSALSCGF
jgi:hypothetical protein